jgi:aspartyl-tRNA(Asn)/glutamyl-tRNA(Gln) amidotransferase subunit A
MEGNLAREDATVVRKLRQAGAVILGKAVTHEWAYGLNTPPTRNPWNLGFHPGSSSAGSGVSVAVGSALGAIGTDSAGSIRNPAAMNGIVGLKPTFGRVSTHGVVPMSPSLDHVGPLARTVRDCALLLQAIAGPDERDPASSDEAVPNYSEALDHGVDGLKLGVARAHFFGSHVDPEVLEAVDAALADLRESGAIVVEIDIPELELMVSIGLAMQLAEMAEYHRQLLPSLGDRYDPNTRFMLEIGQFLPATAYIRAIRARPLVQRVMTTVFQQATIDVLASPTLPGTSFPLDEPGHASFVEQTGSRSLGAYVRHMVPANVTGQPAMSIPCGVSSEGMPIGLQLIGRPFDETTVFRIGHAYECLHGWAARRPDLGIAAGSAGEAPENRMRMVAGLRPDVHNQEVRGTLDRDIPDEEATKRPEPQH